MLHLRAEVAPEPAPLPPALLQFFAAVVPTADFRHDLVKAMRGWRRGIPTLVLTNATGAALEAESQEGARHNEMWVHYPDHPEFQVTSQWCSRGPGAVCDKRGDPRAAMAPLLARQYLGDGFRWLVYGDVSADKSGGEWGRRAGHSCSRGGRRRQLAGLLCRRAVPLLPPCLQDDIAFAWPGLLRLVAGLSPEDPYLLSDNLYRHAPSEHALLVACPYACCRCFCRSSSTRQ